MKKRILCIIQMVIFVLFFLFSAACTVAPTEEKKIRVVLESGSHFSVLDESIKEVTRGQDATFNIAIDEGYYYGSNNVGADYSNGKLTLRNVTTPKTIVLDILATLYTVKLNGAAGMRLTKDGEEVSTLVKTTEYGQDVPFNVEVLPNYEYVGLTVIGDGSKNTSAMFLNNTLTVQNVKENVEVYMQLRYTAAEEKSSYAVTLASGVGYTVKGESKKEVPAGESATFEVTVAEGYYYVSNNCGAEYKDGKVTLKNVNAEQEISLVFRRENAERVTYTGGAVEIVTNALGVIYTAIPDQGYAFCGWENEEKTYAYVNELVVSEAQAQSLKLVPSFVPTAKARLVEYHANGGKLAGSVSKNDAVTYSFSSKIYLYPTTMGEWCFKSFEREGFVPVEYNTKPDGSGTAYSLGSRIFDDASVTTLYVMWEEENPASYFEYTVTDKKEVTLTKYKGTAKKVVIPTQIGGMPVTTVQKGCFDGGEIENVILTKNLNTVEKGAFNNCKQLTDISVTDSVRYIYDESFVGCEKLANLRMIAALPPTFTNHLVGTVVRRFERLYNTREDYRPNVITYGGSSIFQGIDGSTMADIIGRSANNFFNGGQNAYVSGPFMMELYSHFMKPKDVMVFVPEYGPEMYSNKLELPAWIATEGFYDAFRYVDLRNYGRVFDSFYDFQNGSISYTFGSKIELIAEGNALTYEDYLDAMDEYFTRGPSFPIDMANVVPKIEPPAFDSFKKSVLNEINNTYHRCYEAKEMKLYFAAYALWEDSFPVEKSAYTNYENWLKENLHFPYISDVTKHFYTRADITDSISHLTRDAAYRHSIVLGNEIKAKMHYDGYQ